MTDELVSVIVVNYNGKEVLEACVKSIFDSSYTQLEVIIVDNSPLSDNSSKEISNKYNVKVVKDGTNRGYSSGNNIGLKLAHGQYILIINNDAVLDKYAIEELILEALRSKSDILQPKIMISSNPNLINSTGLEIHFAGFGLLRGCGEYDSGQYDQFLDISAPHGACFFAKSSVLKEL